MSASPSPSLPGRLTSPAPRMTSPQHHRIGGPPMQGRILTSPSHTYAQQNIVQTQMIVNQHRFVRPQQQQVICCFFLFFIFVHKIKTTKCIPKFPFESIFLEIQ